MHKKSILFYSVIAIFLGSAVVTLLGLSQVIEIKDEYQKWLLTTLIGQVVVAVISLFKGTDFFDEPNSSPAESVSLKSETPTKPVPCPNIGNPPKKATKKEEKGLLAELKQWKILDPSPDNCQKVRELHRVYEFRSFEAAFKFMNQAVTDFISIQDHHPRWENTYNRVEVWLSTFNLDGEISNRDIKLAKDLEDLWVSLGRGM